MSHIQLPIRLIYGTQISVENDTLQDLRKKSLLGTQDEI